MNREMANAKTPHLGGYIGDLRWASVKKSTKDKAGECNFHPEEDYHGYSVVYEITGNRVAVRICNRCFDEIIKGRNRL